MNLPRAVFDRSMRRIDPCALALLISSVLAAGCAGLGNDHGPTAGSDPHSFSRPDQIAVGHMDLDLKIDFDNEKIEGRASLTLDRRSDAEELWLDIWGLDIREVRLEPGMTEAAFRLGEPQPFLGRALIVPLEPETRRVHVDYVTGPAPVALQWLAPSQTAGGKNPFLLTQSETVFARTWIPCQDSPAVRVTYDATVQVPPGLMALMSAENPTEPSTDGRYRFSMTNSIPPYLLALAVGDLEFRAMGPRTGVYAEPQVVEKAAWEFADTEKMLEVAERLAGPYRWSRFDMIVLPASFPFGGMENPRLSFITPTLLAGDRSLVATVAHELAHSWSGNQVTNATWNDVWLNEGLTVYLEMRIMEEIYGREYSEMLAALELDALREELVTLGEDGPDTHLRLDLRGRDADEAFSDVAYQKGYRLFRLLEETTGREAWDAFLLRYFDEFAFQSIDSDRFLDYVRENLLEPRDDTAAVEAKLDLEGWIDGPGLPPNVPRGGSGELARVRRDALAWLEEGRKARTIDTRGWTTHHWLQFLRALPTDLAAERLAELDRAFSLTDTGNSEVLHAWLMLTLGRGHAPADAALERFLTRVGRQKFVRPLYERLAESPEGLERARAIYARARPGYHRIVVGTVDGILEPEAD